jgi:hypothetical protein
MAADRNRGLRHGHRRRRAHPGRGEQIAAKTALQEAAAIVAERLLLKIAGFKPADAE